MAPAHGEGGLSSETLSRQDAERGVNPQQNPDSSLPEVSGEGLGSSSSSTAGRAVGSGCRAAGATDAVGHTNRPQELESNGVAKAGARTAGHVSGWMEELADVAGQAEVHRNPFDEHRQVKPHLNSPLRANAYYYLICRRWYVEWLQWVGHPDTQSPKLGPLPEPLLAELNNARTYDMVLQLPEDDRLDEGGGANEQELRTSITEDDGSDRPREARESTVHRGGREDSPMNSAAKRTRTRSWTKERPGPIDNRELLETDGSSALRSTVQERQDYEIISEEAWNLFQSWYGGGPAIKRRAITLPNGVIQVELRGLRLKVWKSSDKAAAPLEVNESKLTTVREFKEHICREMGLEVDKTRIWDYFNKKPYALIDDKPDDSLEACRIYDENPILIEEPAEDGSWPVKRDAEQDDAVDMGHNMTSLGSYSVHGYGYGTSSSSQDVPSVGQPPQRGVVGLQNLGNTCFMNSSLQCLSNIPALREYFLTEEYKDSLNRTAYKTEGKLAESFAALLSLMWRQDTTKVAPRNFKYQVGQFAEQFSGYGQQDSMELIEYVLDGLKEDCNRVTGTKPYIEVKEADGRSDEEVAEEALSNYSKRNSSRVDDLFVGLFKSVVKCPEENCGNVSVTFDPFLSAKLPLVTTAEQRMTQFSLTFVRDTCPTGSAPVIQVTVKVNKDHSVKELIEAAAREVEGLRAQNCFLVEIYNKKVHKFFEDTEAIDNIRSDDTLVLLEVAEPKAFFVSSLERWGTPYDTTCTEQEGSDMSPTAAVPLCGAIVYHREVRRGLYSDEVSSRSRELRGLPMFISIAKQVTCRELCKQVERKLREIVLAPGENMAGWSLYKVEKYSPTGEGTEICPDSDEALNLRDSREHFVVEWHLDATLPARLKKDEEIMNNTSYSTRQERENGEQELTNLLRSFTEEEKLGVDDAWYCNRCKDHKEAFKRLEFHRTPPVLVLQLKRFQFTRWSRERLNNPVHFPLEGLDMAPYCTESSRRGENANPDLTTYDLAAVSKHIGSLGGGHYVAYCRSSLDGEWYYFDDGGVRHVSASEVEQDKVGAYVLFYIRRDHRPSMFGAVSSP